MITRLRARLPVIDWSAVVLMLLVPTVLTALSAGLGQLLFGGDPR